MNINKVIYYGNELLDLTNDTVTPDKLYSGYTAHAKDGSLITGTLTSAPLEPYVEEYNLGYVNAGTWIYENPTNTYADIYEVLAGHLYFITLGENVGSRFRAMFTTVDVTTITSGRVTGTSLINTNNPAKYANTRYTPESDGYIIIAKDNAGKTDIKSYVYDVTAGWL